MRIPGRPSRHPRDLDRPECNTHPSRANTSLDAILLPTRRPAMRNLFLSTIIPLIALLAFPFAASHAGGSPPPQARNVVLFHAAWADVSRWTVVHPLLHLAG